MTKLKKEKEYNAGYLYYLLGNLIGISEHLENTETRVRLLTVVKEIEKTLKVLKVLSF